MGFFSWETSDTYRSISNVHSVYGALPVYVLCPNGDKIYEGSYEGYGVFGGKDIYVLLAIWNKPEECLDEDGNYLSDEELRDIGLELAFSGEKLKYPIKIVENPDLSYSMVGESTVCKRQGYFYN